MRTLTLAETLAGAERAHKRVERWPQWKRELSRFKPTDFAEGSDKEFMNTINIDGIDKVDLLIALHGASQPLGLGWIPEVEGGGSLDRAEVEGWLEQTKYFDYVQGRVVKCDLKGPEMDVWGYDRDNGPGAAEAVVSKLRVEETP